MWTKSQINLPLISSAVRESRSLWQDGNEDICVTIDLRSQQSHKWSIEAERERRAKRFGCCSLSGYHMVFLLAKDNRLPSECIPWEFFFGAAPVVLLFRQGTRDSMAAGGSRHVGKLTFLSESVPKGLRNSEEPLVFCLPYSFSSRLLVVPCCCCCTPYRWEGISTTMAI